MEDYERIELLIKLNYYLTNRSLIYLRIIKKIHKEHPEYFIKTERFI
jgi:hypothetical protein